MEQEIIQRIHNFKLSGEENEGLHLELTDITVSQEECSKSLVGKLYGEKVANYTGLKNMLATIWLGVGQVKVRELGINLYQFVFASQNDRLKVLREKAWTFDSQYLLLKPWEEDTDF